jgi:hypothetical protein
VSQSLSGVVCCFCLVYWRMVVACGAAAYRHSNKAVWLSKSISKESLQSTIVCGINYLRAAMLCSHVVDKGECRS